MALATGSLWCFHCSRMLPSSFTRGVQWHSLFNAVPKSSRIPGNFFSTRASTFNSSCLASVIVTDADRTESLISCTLRLRLRGIIVAYDSMTWTARTARHRPLLHSSHQPPRRRAQAKLQAPGAVVGALVLYWTTMRQHSWREQPANPQE